MGGPGSGRKKGSGKGGSKVRTQSYMGQTQKAQVIAKNKGSLLPKKAKKLRAEKRSLKQFGVNKRVENK